MKSGSLLKILFIFTQYSSNITNNMADKKYFIYMRRSQDSEERQVLSIPAQEDVLMKIALRENLHIVGEPFKESHTAKAPGRPIFNEMMERIRKGEANSILTWHLNRLARNPVDEMAIKWGLKNNTLLEVKTPDRTYVNTPDDGFMSSLMFAMATKYSDDISTNVRRGNKAALERGLWPGRPKMGYMRDPDTKKMIPDPKRFHLIREMWDMRLTEYTIADIAKTARDNWGLKTIQNGKYGGNLISSSYIWKILSDPFYMGVMVRREGTFKGDYIPMITAEEFERVQNITKKYNKGGGPRFRKLSLVYRGLISCARCGSIVTGERKTNRYGYKYIYWHCSQKRKGYNYCPERSVREEYLDKEIAKFLELIKIPDEVHNFIMDELDSFEDSRIEVDNKIQLQRKLEIQRVDNKLKRLREMCADGLISNDELSEDRKDLLIFKAKLEQKQEECLNTKKFLEPFKRSISFANLAKNKFENGNLDEKRQIIKSVFSNLSIKEKTLLISAKKPFNLYTDLGQNPFGWAQKDAIRNLFYEILENPEILSHFKPLL